MLPWGLLLRLLYAKSQYYFFSILINERRTRLCCLVILQKYNSNLAPVSSSTVLLLGHQTRTERLSVPEELHELHCQSCEYTTVAIAWMACSRLMNSSCINSAIIMLICMITVSASTFGHN